MEQVIARIVSRLQAAGIDTENAFPPALMRRLTSARAAVEVKSVKAVPGSFCDYLGMEEDEETGAVERYGRRLGGTVLVRIFAPTAIEAAKCAAEAAQSLAQGVAGLSVEAVTVSEPVYDAAGDYHTRDVELAFSAYFYALKTEEDGVFLNFKLEGTVN